MTVDPAKTYVISVGISRYAINDTWDLSLAGDYAMRFVEWARSYHVPPGNIFLFLADMDHKRLAGQARQAGVAIRSATSDEVNGFLKSSTFYDLSGDLLYTYWFGHGSVTNNGTRHLFFSDMRPDLAPTLDFNHYLLRLRSKGLSNFRLQNAFIDACASRYSDLRELEVEPASLNPPAKGDADYVDQRCIFSAKAGVEAVAGRFSEYILDELRRRSAKQWPPDSDSIARAASRNPKLKGQHPQQFYIKTASEEYSVGELPASVSINRAADQAHCGVSWFRSFAEVAAGLPTLSTSNSARRRLYCAAVNRTDDNRTNRLTPYDDLLESVAFAYATNHVPQLQAAYKALEERSFELDQIISRINLLRDANIALSHCGFAPDTLISAFAASIRTLPHDPIREGMPLQSMLYELAQAESGGEMYKARPLYEFVLRLAADPRITPAASAKLHAFVTSHCPVAMKASIESELRAKLRFILSVSIDQEEQNGPLGVVAHLMSEDEILRQFTVRKYYGRTVCDTDDAVAARVSDIVKDVRTFLKAPEHDEVDVEFLLPLELFGALAPDSYNRRLR